VHSFLQDSQQGSSNLERQNTGNITVEADFYRLPFTKIPAFRFWAHTAQSRTSNHALCPRTARRNVCKLLMLKGNIALILRGRPAPHPRRQQSCKDDYFLQYFHSFSRL